MTKNYTCGEEIRILFSVLLYIKSAQCCHSDESFYSCFFIYEQTIDHIHTDVDTFEYILFSLTCGFLSTKNIQAAVFHPQNGDL